MGESLNLAGSTFGRRDLQQKLQGKERESETYPNKGRGSKARFTGLTSITYKFDGMY